MSGALSGEVAASAPPGQCVLVIEIGGTSIKFGFVVDGRPAAFTRKLPTDLMRAADPLTVLAGAASGVIAEAGLTPDSVVATAPGHIDRDFDLLLHIVNVQEMNGMRLASGLARALGLPVWLERDVVLLLLGERAAGAARGEDHVLGIFFGTGIGAAYLGERGEPFRGGGWALEIGHMPFRGEGRQLSGQTIDTLEAYASGRAVQGLADASGVPVGQLFAASGRSAGLVAALDELVRDQAFCVGAAMAMMSPRVVVLGGGIADMPGYPRERLVALIEAHSPLPAAVGRLDVRWARLGWEAALYGAGDLVRAGTRAPVLP